MGKRPVLFVAALLAATFVAADVASACCLDGMFGRCTACRCHVMKCCGHCCHCCVLECCAPCASACCEECVPSCCGTPSAVPAAAASGPLMLPSQKPSPPAAEKLAPPMAQPPGEPLPSAPAVKLPKAPPPMLPSEELPKTLVKPMPQPVEKPAEKAVVPPIPEKAVPAKPAPEAPAKPAKPAADNPFGQNDVRSPRSWTDISGQYRIEARLVSVRDGVVRLATNDGSVFRIAAAKLSVVDQQWIQGQTRSLATAW